MMLGLRGAWLSLLFSFPLLVVPPAKSQQKQDVEGVAPIPSAAALVCQSSRDQERSGFGPPATEIYVAGPEGENPVRITHHRRLYNHIAVSPNRRYIAAGRFEDGDTNHDGKINAHDRKRLVVLDLLERKEWRPVPNADDACLGGVDWTPDGQWIIASMRFGGTVDIYKVHPDGSGLENITRNLPRLLGVPGRLFVSDVSTSFDGEWIVFTSVSRRGANARLVRMRIDGSAASFITDGGGFASRNPRSAFGAGDFDPEFSPDGQYVSFQRSTRSGRGLGGFPTYDVMRVRVDGSDLKDLSPRGNRYVQGVSDWSLNNKIIFNQWAPPPAFTGPIVVNPDGTGYHQLERLRGCTWVKYIPPREPMAERESRR